MKPHQGKKVYVVALIVVHDDHLFYIKHILKSPKQPCDSPFSHWYQSAFLEVFLLHYFLGLENLEYRKMRVCLFR